jgi:hypothetical protein
VKIFREEGKPCGDPEQKSEKVSELAEQPEQKRPSFHCGDLVPPELSKPAFGFFAGQARFEVTSC